MNSITRNLHWAPTALIALIFLLAGCSSSDDNKQKQDDQGSQPASKKAQVMEMAKRNIDLENLTPPSWAANVKSWLSPAYPGC